MFKATSERHTVEVVDVHVGGDLHRIVFGGIKEAPGATILDKMEYFRDKADGLRQLLLHEPRGGHPSLYADLVLAPVHPSADAAFIIMEEMGYPLISGTNTMSTAIALLETGRIPMKEGIQHITLEAPGGLIAVEAQCSAGKVVSVTYEAATPSFIAARGISVELGDGKTVVFDVIWTGAFYPLLRAEDLGFELERHEESRLVSFSQEFIAAVRAKYQFVHPVFGDEGPLSFVLFVSDAVKTGDRSWERGVCCYEYPRNSVCRAPAGVPSTAALVQLVDKGELGVGDVLKTTSIFRTSLSARVTRIEPYHGHDGVCAAVSGQGYLTAKSELIVDFSDPLTPSDGLELVLG